MPIVVQVVATTPKVDVRQTSTASWNHSGAHRICHPASPPHHMAYLVGAALHAVDVWESREGLDASSRPSGPIAEKLGALLAGPPQVGELLDVVVPAQ